MSELCRISNGKALIISEKKMRWVLQVHFRFKECADNWQLTVRKLAKQEVWKEILLYILYNYIIYIITYILPFLLGREYKEKTNCQLSVVSTLCTSKTLQLSNIHHRALYITPPNPYWKGRLSPQFVDFAVDFDRTIRQNKYSGMLAWGRRILYLCKQNKTI